MRKEITKIMEKRCSESKKAVDSSHATRSGSYVD